MAHIVAMGGGGFSMNEGPTALDAYVLSLIAARRPQVCFLATASGDATSYVERFHAAFGELDCTTRDLPADALASADVEAGVTDSFGPQLDALDDGLGWIPGSFCPHFDGEPRRRPTYHRLVASGALPDGYAADDGAALHVEDGRVRAITEHPGAGVYRVEQAGEQARESMLATTPL